MNALWLLELQTPEFGGYRFTRCGKDNPINQTFPKQQLEQSMTSSTVARNGVRGLPEELQIAQRAINLPEVKEMLKKLSQYHLGIYMPHMHDEKTGAFRPLPPGITQVEDGLVVSFLPQEDCVDQGDTSFITVGWFLHPETMATDEDDADKKKCVSRCRDTVHGHQPYHGQL